LYSKINVKELSKIKSPNLIDIRETYEFKKGSIPHSINIPMNTLLTLYEIYLKKDTRYYIFCQSGNRSSKACQFLYDKGYDVVEITDGYKNWVELNKIL
jgi:rhodanese-related sulfurtransferase